MIFRKNVKRVFAPLMSVITALALSFVGAIPARAFSLYDVQIQSSLRNLATAVESYALMNDGYSGMTISELKDWGWAPEANAYTAIHIVESGQGWWASSQDVRGSAEYIYSSGNYLGEGDGSVQKASHQPTAAPKKEGVDIFDAGSEMNVQALLSKLMGAGIGIDALCADLVFLPGTHSMESSASDESLGCSAIAMSGGTISDAIHMLLEMGSIGVLEALAIDVIPDGSIVKIPDHETSSWIDRIPQSLPGNIWNLSKIRKRARTAGLSAVAAETVAQRCGENILRRNAVSEVIIPMMQACSSMPLFISGNDLSNEASEHDFEAIKSYPIWTILSYDNKNATSTERRWYRNLPECTIDKAEKTDCDEFPFFSTEQGGADASPRPSLKRISSSSNRSQGSLLGNFYKNCSLNSGDDYVVVPLPSSLVGSDDTIATGGVCNVG